MSAVAGRAASLVLQLSCDTLKIELAFQLPGIFRTSICSLTVKPFKEEQMADTLRIFISHKMPADTDLAQQIGSRLALYGGNQIKVTHAGKFRYSENWRSRIQQELDQAHWLIYLYTDPDEDWGFCLFECGYFNRTMESDDRKRLITFCRS